MADEKICFVISPIGREESPTRKWADQTVKHLIRPAVESQGLAVIRADQEDRAGIITTHVIQRLVSADLVVADLTQRNPNVFYELAVRHVTRKPLVQVIRAEEEIPFDVQSMRTVKFELDDPDVLEGARKALSRQVAAVLDEDEIETPISQAVGQQLALESGDPAKVELAELAQAVQSLTAEVRGRTAPYFCPELLERMSDLNSWRVSRDALMSADPEMGRPIALSALEPEVDPELRTLLKWRRRNDPEKRQRPRKQKSDAGETDD